MNVEKVGTTRRSSLVSTFGIGALIAMQDDSVMVCGLDYWPPWTKKLPEERLASSLGVQELRVPSANSRSGDVPAVRFPEWGFCTNCRRLDHAWKLVSGSSRRCKLCATGTIAPSRFVACCNKGHIEDFPYWSWVHQGREANPGTGHDLHLRPKGESSMLADLQIRCSCGAIRSLDGAFGAQALKGVRRCHGQRPWLPGGADEQCDQQLRTLQRGSSNVWFGLTRSAISIPSPRHRAQDFVAMKLPDFAADKSAEEIAGVLNPPQGCTRQHLVEAIQELRAPAATRYRPSEEELRREEYDALTHGSSDALVDRHFECHELPLAGAGLPPEIAQVSRVGRLREVSALYGFTRIVPHVGDGDDSTVAALSTEKPTWLPAIEVLGEGIFIRLHEDAVQQWETSEFARSRVELLLRNQDHNASSTAFSFEAPSGRSLLLHSLAHILVDELALSSGYPAASLRERVFDANEQAGILIYTATADSAGSLGGLAAQSEPTQLAALLRTALRRAEWCTTDPICIESTASGINGMNLAACHACLLLPETSCERFNVGLDRAAVVGSPNEGGLQAGAFFSTF